MTIKDRYRLPMTHSMEGKTEKGASILQDWHAMQHDELLTDAKDTIVFYAPWLIREDSGYSTGRRNSTGLAVFNEQIT